MGTLMADFVDSTPGHGSSKFHLAGTCSLGMPPASASRIGHNVRCATFENAAVGVGVIIGGDGGCDVLDEQGHSSLVLHEHRRSAERPRYQLAWFPHALLMTIHSDLTS